MNAPFRLVSLWEMMQLPLGKLFYSVVSLANFSQSISGRAREHQGAVVCLSTKHWRMLVKAANDASKYCEAVQLTVSGKHFASVAEAIKSQSVVIDGARQFPPPGAQQQVLVSRLESAVSTFKIESLEAVALMLDGSQARMMEPNGPLFGAEVASAFPKAAEDIEEAGKCMALGRYTATVFHLMRAMEVAAQALAGKLGVANLDREWGKLLSDMKTKIEALPLGQDRNRWSENHSLLYHVKQAWRNDVMHPKATYTEAQAQEVFNAVDSYLRNLAPLV